MRLAALVALILAQLGKPPATRITLAPDLIVIGTSEKPYTVAKSCGPGQPAITFTLIAQNAGTAPSTAINDPHGVFVQDTANAGWAAGATLPALQAGGSAHITVTLPGLQSPGSMSGHHVFTVTVDALKAVAEQSYTNNSITIAIDLPQGFCAPLGALPPVAPSNIAAPLPAPQNLTNTITQGVCTKYGGPAAALACSAALPAGKLVLVWDYPSNVTVDGFHVYATGSGGLLRNVGGPKPAATQTAPGVRLAILDPPPVGTCFAVAAFHGANESPHSPTSFCVSANDLAKSVSFQPDQVGTMYASVYADPTKSVQDNIYSNGQTYQNSVLTPFYHSAGGGMSVGSDHVADLWRDLAHTQVSDYKNTVYRAYIHFNTSSLNGRNIAKASLKLHANSNTICMTQYGAAGGWKPGQPLGVGGSMPASSQGPDASLDVTKIVQGWATTPSSNGGFALQDDTSLDLYHMVIISSSCVTGLQSATLVVSYY